MPPSPANETKRSPFIPDGAFRLLLDLEANNNHEWFRAHKVQFDTLVVEPFIGVLEEASRQLAATKWPVSGGRATLFRQLRDQRFAKDTPYATSIRALMTASGNKPTSEGCVHVELSAGGGFVGVGFHRPSASLLEPIRRGMLRNPAAWRAALEPVSSAGLALTDDRVQRMPKGFTDAADHPLADDIRLRSIEYVVPMSRSDWTDGSAASCIASAVRPGLALLRFGNTLCEAGPSSGASGERQ